MTTFSQRYGLKQVPRVVQIDTMSDELRSSIWNVFDEYVWSHDSFLCDGHGGMGTVDWLSRELWPHYFKKPIDSRPDDYVRPGAAAVCSAIRVASGRLHEINKGS